MHLFADGPAPVEYVLLNLYREFSTTPPALRDGDAVGIMRILDMMSAEQRVRKMREQMPHG